MIKVSIIVPVYNVEKYLKKCLNSLINQTLKDIEIICINDGSTDSSLDIINKFKSEDIRIRIINQDNMGQSFARNAGIAGAQGEYIGFVDSDDWVDKNYFEKLYKTAIQYDADIACAGYKRCTKGNGSIRKKYGRVTETTNINTKIKLDNIPADNYIWNKIYKRQKWLETNLSFEEGRIFEDIALVIKIINSMEKFVTVPNTYYHYRRRKDSTITLLKEKKDQDYEWAIKEMYNYAKENNICLDETDNITKKEYIKMFKLTLLKIIYSQRKVKYNLFGFIPFAEIITK